MVLSKLRIRALTLAASLAISLTAGCGISSNSALPALQKVGNLEKTTLKVAVLANLDSAGFFVALHEGLFAAEGLDVQYTPAFSDDIIAQQAKGQFDITGMNYVSYIEAQLARRAVRRQRHRRHQLRRHQPVPRGRLRGDQGMGQSQPRHPQGIRHRAPSRAAYRRHRPAGRRGRLLALPQGQGHVDRRTAAIMALSNYPLGITPVRLQRVADVMQQFGLLKTSFHINQLLH